MKRKKFGTMNDENRDAVFTALVSEYVLPNMYGQDSGKIINVVVMQNRWDGRYGFAGGKVDGNETLIEAARRELAEEINVTKEETAGFNFEEVCTHEFSIGGEKTMNTHLYMVKVNLEDLKGIMARSFSSEHIISENCGNVFVHLENYKNKGFNQFIKNNFASSVKEELVILARHLSPNLEIEADIHEDALVIKDIEN